MGVAADEIDHGRLHFLVRANIFKGCRVSPKTPAELTFAHTDLIYPNYLQAGLASGTLARVLFIYYGDSPDGRSAMRAEFGSFEHQSQTFRATDRFQTRSAKFALRLVAHNGAAAVRAI
jgi:hypothetical protein